MTVTHMAFVGDPVRNGLEVVRLKLGETAYRFVMRFARKSDANQNTIKKLDAIGSLCGLNSHEIETASNGTKNARFPFWLRVFLIAAAFIAASSVIVIALSSSGSLYTPGTDYASLSPNDFQ